MPASVSRSVASPMRSTESRVAIGTYRGSRPHCANPQITATDATATRTMPRRGPPPIRSITRVRAVMALLPHLDHRAIRLGELVADLDEELEGDPRLLRGGHHLVDLHGLPPQEGRDRAPRLVLQLGDVADGASQRIRERGLP